VCSLGGIRRASDNNRRGDSRCLRSVREVHTVDHEADQERNVDGTLSGKMAIGKALYNQTLESRLSQGDHNTRCAYMIDAKTGINERGNDRGSYPNRIFELLNDLVAKCFMIVVEFAADVSNTSVSGISAMGQSSMSIVSKRQSSGCKNSSAAGIRT
jgi:hypothetical protein